MRTAAVCTEGRVSRSILVALLCALAVLSVVPAVAQNLGGERRVALVIGNSGYNHVPRLTNAGNDATLIATTLRQLGFTLVGGGAQANIDKPHFDHLVQEFGRAIQGADVALFYYAGHGMQVDGNNWLVPIDANPTRTQDLEFQMVNADLVLRQMDGAGTRLNLVILDACRNNPFTALGTRAAQGGLAQMRAPEGTMISFATQPGNVAADGSGANGPYATALAASMHQPGLDIFRTFNRVGLIVKHDTAGAQVPWVSSSPIDGEFYFTQSDTMPDAIGASTLDALPGVSVAPRNGARGATATATNDAPTAGKSSAPHTASAAITLPVDQQAPDTSGRLQSLAEQGKADAQIDLGLAYAKGTGVAQDDATARHWFELAAAQGAAKAQFLLGSMLERGRGGPRSYADAMQWYRRAAEQNYAPAEAAMGRFYGRGLGVDRDVAQRTDWFRRAADHGSPAGEWVLGNFYQFGDHVEANIPLAVQLYQRAAGQGFVPAEVRLGLLYERGNLVQQNYAEAMRWFRLAADAGNATALNSLGGFYRHGWAVPQDYARAMNLFQQAADKGNTMALFNIGVLYAEGLGVKKDRVQARDWFEKAAAAGNQPAISRLARIDAECRAGGSPASSNPPGNREAHLPPARKC